MNYCRVTQALSAHTDWSKIPADVLEFAATRGTIVHGYCYLYALGEFIPFIRPDCQGYFDSFCRWYDLYVEETIVAEQRFFDDTYGFCGIPDLLCRYKREEAGTLVDLKSPLATAPAWKLQVAAYWHLLTSAGYDVARAGSLRLRQDGGIAIFDEYTPDLIVDLNVFFNAVAVHRFFHPNEGVVV